MSIGVYMYFEDLFQVIVISLACMMVVILFGSCYDYAVPKEVKPVVYECDFKMKNHTLTAPCTIRGVYHV